LICTTLLAGESGPKSVIFLGALFAMGRGRRFVVPLNAHLQTGRAGTRDAPEREPPFNNLSVSWRCCFNMFDLGRVCVTPRTTPALRHSHVVLTAYIIF